MANGLYDANAIAQYSLNLMRGQMITQLIGGQLISGGQGVSLEEFILGRTQKPKRTGTDIMNDALTGLMRSDAAMLRQGAKNMDLGKALLDTGAEALGAIHSKVTRMQEIVAELKTAEETSDPQLLTLRATYTPEYEQLSKDIKSYIEGTSYNGLKILDGSTWAADGRVTPDASGTTAKLELQAGNGQNTLTLYDLKNSKDSFHITDLNDLTNLTLASDSLSVFATQLQGMQASYKARSSLLDTESMSMVRQADILDEATGRAEPDNEESLRQILVDILMRENGSILNGNS